MGPIEFVFLAILLIFAAIGVVRGASRELGVTSMLLIGLLLIKLLDTQFEDKFADLLHTTFGVTSSAMPGVIALIACTIMIFVTFISYQGATLTFPIRRETGLFGLGLGLINGYLFAGSLWWYLEDSGWPLFQKLIQTGGAYTPFNLAVQKLLPPAVFEWKLLVFLVIALLILRVWK